MTAGFLVAHLQDARPAFQRVIVIADNFILGLLEVVHHHVEGLCQDGDLVVGLLFHVDV